MSAISLSSWRRLEHSYDLLRELVARDLKMRYKRSIFGFAWSMINPLAQILMFTFLFNKVLPLNIPNYTAFVFTGVLAWSWFSSALLSAPGRSCIMGNWCAVPVSRCRGAADRHRDDKRYTLPPRLANPGDLRGGGRRHTSDDPGPPARLSPCSSVLRSAWHT